jgi:ABC-type multidrug transport system fused ATPase/permease subunit
MILFWNLNDSTQEGIQSRESLMYLTVTAEVCCCLLAAFDIHASVIIHSQNYILMIVLMERFCTEIRIFDREQQDKMYTPSAYFLAHFVSSIPQLVLQPFLFATPIYFGCNCRAGFEHFLVYLSVAVITAFIINGIAWVSVCLHREFSVASLIGNTSFTFLALTSGFLVNFEDLPVYINWLHYISYMNYGFRVLMINEFGDREFPGCPYADPGDCILWNGDSIMQARNVFEPQMASSVILLAVLCVSYHALSMMLLYVIKFPPSGAAGDPSAIESENDTFQDLEEGKGHAVDNPCDEIKHPVTAKTDENSRCRHVNIDVQNISVYMRPKLSILNQVFKLGKNVVAVEHPLTTSASYEAIDPSITTEVYSRDLVSPLTSNSFDGESQNEEAEDITGGNIRDASRGSFINEFLFDTKAKPILISVSASIQPGRVVALMGGSGSGNL